jgi:hypothetical protein
MSLFTPIASTAAEYWNSESEDAGMSYLDMLNDPFLPSTVGAEFNEANTSTDDNFTRPFDTATSIAGDLSSNTENMDLGWPLHSNGPRGVSAAYNFDFMDDSDQGYLYCKADYSARFRFDPIAATAHSSHQPDLFLPLPTCVVDSPPPDSPNPVPQVNIRVPDNPNKRLRISNFTEENILPENERRKRSKPDRLTL